MLQFVRLPYYKSKKGKCLRHFFFLVHYAQLVMINQFFGYLYDNLSNFGKHKPYSSYN